MDKNHTDWGPASRDDRYRYDHMTNDRPGDRWSVEWAMTVRLVALRQRLVTANMNLFENLSGETESDRRVNETADDQRNR